MVAKTSGVVRKSSKTAARPLSKRPPIRLGQIKTGRIVKRLREPHELGGDPALERFPASEELFLVLERAQTWAGRLKQPEDSPVNVVGEAAVVRAKLWQYVREQADAGQLKAIEDGRAAGVPWTHIHRGTVRELQAGCVPEGAAAEGRAGPRARRAQNARGRS